MPTVSFSYMITASMATPMADIGYAVRVPASSERQLLKRLHFTFPPGSSGAEKQDPLGNHILTGIRRGTTARLAFTVSGKARIDPEQFEDGPPDQYTEPTSRTHVGAFLRLFYLHHSAVGDDVDRARHFCMMLREDFSCRPGFAARDTAEEAMEARSGAPEDAAHIILSLCRLDHIAARFVSGLTSHGPSAWIEVWDGRHWIPIDPRTGEVCDHCFLKIAHGRDGDDVALAALSKGCRLTHVEIHSTLTVDHSSTH